MTVDRRMVVMGAAGAAAVGGLARAAAPLPATPVIRADVPPGIAGLAVRWAFTITLFFKERIRIESSYNGEATHRSYVPTIGGEVYGPRLQGRVIPYGGADYGGSRGFEAHYMLQATDGALIYINNVGMLRRTDDFKGRPPSDTPMRVAPRFDAPVGPHDWMNRTLFVGNGTHHRDPDRSVFTYWEVL